MSIDIHPSTHFGTLRLEGEITEEVALQFEAALDLLFGYYQYKRITLEINSRGGQVVARRGAKPPSGASSRGFRW